VTGIYLGINQNDSGVYLLGGQFADTSLYVDTIENVMTLLDNNVELVDNFDTQLVATVPSDWVQAIIPGA
jgi:hypothetical protein